MSRNGENKDVSGDGKKGRKCSPVFPPSTLPCPRGRKAKGTVKSGEIASFPGVEKNL